MSHRRFTMQLDSLSIQCVPVCIQSSEAKRTGIPSYSAWCSIRYRRTASSDRSIFLEDTIPIEARLIQRRDSRSFGWLHWIVCTYDGKIFQLQGKAPLGRSFLTSIHTLLLGSRIGSVHYRSMYKYCAIACNCVSSG